MGVLLAGLVIDKDLRQLELFDHPGAALIADAVHMYSQTSSKASSFS